VFFWGALVLVGIALLMSGVGLGFGSVRLHDVRRFFWEAPYWRGWLRDRFETFFGPGMRRILILFGSVFVVGGSRPWAHETRPAL